MLWRLAATQGVGRFLWEPIVSFPWELLRVNPRPQKRTLRVEHHSWTSTTRSPDPCQAPHENRCLHYFCGPTRSLIGGTLVVSQVNARQPSCQPSSIVASMDWWL